MLETGLFSAQARALIFSVAIAFFVCLAIGPYLIKVFTKMKFGQTVRDDGPQSHLKKQGTPTFGGIIFYVGILVSALCLARVPMDFTIALLVATLGFGLIGFLDDYIKVKKKRSLGLKPLQKIVGQMVLAISLSLYCYFNPLVGSAIYIPILDVTWDMGLFYVPFAVFVFIAMTNGSNLTDGLDGLLSGTSIIITASFGVLTYALMQTEEALGSPELSAQLHNVLIFSGAMTGGLLGFLRFNSHPAKVFMGDTGSIGIGAAIAMMGLLTKMVILLPIMAGVFVASSLSVILQVTSYKYRNGKRIFKMAPLHHHFELLGMPEVKVVAMYMIVTVLLCLLTFAIL